MEEEQPNSEWVSRVYSGWVSGEGEVQAAMKTIAGMAVELENRTPGTLVQL